MYVIKFIYSFLLPPGLFILLSFFLGIWLWRIRKKIGAPLLLFSLFMYIASMQLTADLLIHSLEAKYHLPRTIKGDVIVMLGAGATGDTADVDGRGQLSGDGANRLLTTARLYNKTHLPIVVSGGAVFADSGNEAEIAKRQLISLGIPADQIIMENKSLNTGQNAMFTKKIIEHHKFKHPILVTSAYHMARSVLNFSSQGIKVVPYPTDYKTSQRLVVDLNKFAPADLKNISIALKEYLGIAALLLKAV